MMTELDEMKAKWEAHDRQLEKSLRLNRELLIASKLKPAESELRRLATYSGLEATMWLVIVVVLGNFIAGHIRMPGLALSAVAVDLMSIGMLIALIRRMIGASHIDCRHSEAGGRPPNTADPNDEMGRTLRNDAVAAVVGCSFAGNFRRGYLQERGYGLGDRQCAVQAGTVPGGDLGVQEIWRPDRPVSVYPAFDEGPGGQ
jgi:hypothetical protein